MSDVREQLVAIGRRWSGSLVELRGDRREPADVTLSGVGVTGSRESHAARSALVSSSLAQQRVDALARLVNVSGKHRHFTTRQRRVIKERDRACVDCGSSEFLEYDHVPDFEITKHTLVDEGQCRCSRCHRNRHRGRVSDPA